MNYRTEQLIESYFAATITEAESKELKAALDSDPEAAAEFAWQQKLARKVSKLSLSKSIQNEQWREAAKSPFRQVKMLRTALAAAAAIVLLIVAYYVIQPGSSPVTTQELVAQSIEHFPNKMKFKNLGGDMETVSPDVLDAFAAYDNKDYIAAAKEMTTVVNANATRMDYRFYLGMAFIGSKKYAETINALTMVAKDTSSYSTPARYFLGVAYAGINDVKQAKKYLNEYIAAEDGVQYRKQANRLLERLK